MTTLRPFFAKRIQILAIISLTGFILSQIFGTINWFLELWSHFVPYYAVIWLMAAWLVSTKIRWLWAICSVCAISSLMLPWQRELPTPAHHALIWYNVNVNNADPRAETQRLLAQQADILALAEIQINQAAWQPLRQAYPHGCEHPSDSPFALAVLARQPLAACRVKLIDGYPYIHALTADRQIAIYALHAPPPINGEMAQSRQFYLQKLALNIATEPRVLVVGDLNSSPFSPIFREFTDAAKVSPQTHYGLPTWLLGLNIDHVLSRGQAVAVQSLDWGESDHRGLKVVWE